jgi:hypothetical protein
MGSSPASQGRVCARCRCRGGVALRTRPHLLMGCLRGAGQCGPPSASRSLPYRSDPNRWSWVFPLWNGVEVLTPHATHHQRVPYDSSLSAKRPKTAAAAPAFCMFALQLARAFTALSRLWRPLSAGITTAWTAGWPTAEQCRS